MNFKTKFNKCLKTLFGFDSKYNLRFRTLVHGVASQLRSYHQKGYDYLVAKPRYVSLTAVLVFVCVYVIFIVPTVVLVFHSLTFGPFSMTYNLNVWELSWIVWQTCSKYLTLCGIYAACETEHGLAYTFQFFYLLSSDLEVLKFHILLGTFLSFTTLYLVSLFMSLANRKPCINVISYASFVFGLCAYMLALWVLGLQNAGPEYPVSFPLLWGLALLMMHVLWWLIRAYQCERLAFRVLLVFLGLVLICYAYTSGQT